MHASRGYALRTRLCPRCGGAVSNVEFALQPFHDGGCLAVRAVVGTVTFKLVWERA